MSSDSSSTPDYYPDPDVISDSDSGDDIIFSAILDAARVLVEHCESSQPLTRRPHRQRDRVGAHERLMQDYFSSDATFNAEQFRRRFRMTRQLFLPIVGDLERDFDFFNNGMTRERHGFPRMLGSLDCTHWAWEAYPVAWQGQYHRGDHDGPTVILEAAASFDLWIWHAFFGMPGANNDIAVINASPLFDRLVNGVGPDTSFSTNGVN
ncbi:uncharacterized protein LOC143626964 [Bidens hawaiensis]|uniref:uncharacterized protein LOC143626964 n=1 Tax=Bidens hawaiensis TaxID=980011 RepID=UPI00404B952D